MDLKEAWFIYSLFIFKTRSYPQNFKIHFQARIFLDKNTELSCFFGNAPKSTTRSPSKKQIYHDFSKKTILNQLPFLEYNTQSYRDFLENAPKSTTRSLSKKNRAIVNCLETPT